ncbi:MAG: sulfatase [Armatimonadota bacterium]|nr:sulfatase [Armatimonadota bacterium]
MNLIVLVTDTLRADHLGCYGNRDVTTPKIDRLAEDGVVFTNTYADGLPTIPMRRVFHTGNTILPEGQWRPLLPDDVTVAQILGESGYTTGLIADCYHMFKPGLNFHEGFDSWQWIRGQESDRWHSGPRDVVDVSRHIPEHLRTERWEQRLTQYLLNMQDREGEADYIVARSCRAAMQWLERNADNAPFMLWLELFDPHEPWDPPPRLREKYFDDYPAEQFHFGYGVDTSLVREEDMPAIRALYEAEIEFVDEWVGRLLDHVDEMGLRDDTAIVFTSDHGTHLGEQGCLQKTPSLLKSIVAQIPLIVRHPDESHAGTRIDALTSGMDIAPMLMRLTGTEDHPPMDGEDLWRLVEDEVQALHDWVLTRFRDFVAARTEDWHYFQGLRASDPGHGPALYDLNADPGETTNVVEEHPEVVEQMRDLLSGCFTLEDRQT